MAQQLRGYGVTAGDYHTDHHRPLRNTYRQGLDYLLRTHRNALITRANPTEVPRVSENAMASGVARGFKGLLEGPPSAVDKPWAVSLKPQLGTKCLALALKQPGEASASSAWLPPCL